MGVPAEVAVMLPRKRSRLCLSKPSSSSLKKSICTNSGSESLNMKDLLTVTDEATGSFSTEQVDDNCSSDSKAGVVDMKDSMVHAANLPATCDPLVPPVASLHNLGNTCFLNCMLEVLRYTPGFLKGVGNLYGEITAEEKRQKEFSKSQSGKIKETPPAWQLLKNVNAMFSEMKSRENSYKEIATSDAACMAVGPSALLESIREMNPMFEGHFQHDAQELLRCLLCYIEDAEREIQRSGQQFQDKKTTKHSNEERTLMPDRNAFQTKRSVSGFAAVKGKASAESNDVGGDVEASRVQVTRSEVCGEGSVKEMRGKWSSTGLAAASSTFMENFLFGDNALQMRGGRGRARKVPANSLKGSVPDVCDENCPLQTVSLTGLDTLTTLSPLTTETRRQCRSEQVIIVDRDEDEPPSKYVRIDQENVRKDDRMEEGEGLLVPDLFSSVGSESRSGQKAALPLVTISSGTAKADKGGANAALRLGGNKENLFHKVQQDFTKSPSKALKTALSPAASSVFPSTSSADGTKMKQTSMLSLFNLLGRFHRLGMRGRVVGERTGSNEDKQSWQTNVELRNTRCRNGLKSVQAASFNEDEDSSNDSIQFLSYEKTEENVSLNAKQQNTVLDVDRISRASEVDPANFDSIINSVTQKYYSSLSPSRQAGSDMPSPPTSFSGLDRSSLPSILSANGCSSNSLPNKVLKPEEEFVVHSPSKIDSDRRSSPRKSPRKKASRPEDSCVDAERTQQLARGEREFASQLPSTFSTLVSDSADTAEHESKALLSAGSNDSSSLRRMRDHPGSSAARDCSQRESSVTGDILPTLKLELKKCDWLGVSPLKSVSAHLALRHMGAQNLSGKSSVCRSLFVGDVKRETTAKVKHISVSKKGRSAERGVEKSCKALKSSEHKKLPDVSVSLTSCDWLGANLDFPISAKKALKDLEQSDKKTRTYAKCVRTEPKRVKNVDDSMTTSGKHATSRTLVESLFGGIMMHRTRCIQCEMHRDRQEAFLDISVPVRNEKESEEDKGSSDDEEEEQEDCKGKDAKRSNSCLSRLMQAFSGVERLVGDNKYFCDHCLCYTEAERSCHYTSMPAVLTLHLKRFCSNPSVFGGVSKINDPVSIPQHLPCLQYGCPQVCSKPEHRYTLFGIVTHSGVSILHGHYRAYVKVLSGLNPDIQTYMHSDSHSSTTAPESAPPTPDVKDGISSLPSEAPSLQISDDEDSVGQGSWFEDDKMESRGKDSLMVTAHEKKEKLKAKEGCPWRTSASFPFLSGQKEEGREEGVKDNWWLECDDECIRVMTEEEFTARLEESCGALMGTPYVLFYHRMDRLV